MTEHPALSPFAPASKRWFTGCFDAPTRAQSESWPAIAEGQSTLLLAPTGSGKTLAAFFCAIDRLLFSKRPERLGVRVLYISPIKALAVDVERNLRAPLSGICASADAHGEGYEPVTIAIRSGDTSQRDRARMKRQPPDILITTPESLYLMLTSQAREFLRTVDVVIIDEIHALVATKRGSHLFTSLERLEAIRESATPLQRIGLSATQRPLNVVARLLGGYRTEGGERRLRPVTIVDAGEPKRLELLIETPVEEMSQAYDVGEFGGHPAMDGVASDGMTRSIWPAVIPRLVTLIGEHRSTLLFVNSRRLAERLASAINELAGDEIALAHHGSLAHAVRADIEDRLKAGRLPAIVATASLELGIDMGAIDLVIQVEAPPSIASGLQRIGRASHHVGGVPKGVTFPKYRGDLVSCAAAVSAMLEGRVESTMYPKNPLDILAQQVVATVAMGPQQVDALYTMVTQAAPFAELSREMFEGVLDMLSGRYPSDDFAELRPRLTWDRLEGTLEARKGAKRLAVINGGTIPERGLYGVFLAGADTKRSRRVGELDEEMVFESRVGEVFLLGASSWRVEEITQDKVLVSPAPGEPGKMPFWHGDRPGRPLEFGREIGAFLARISAMEASGALETLTDDYHLEPAAAHNLLRYLQEQQEEGVLPTDKRIVIERFVDVIGDWRICILSPFGGKVHAPWAMAVRAALLDTYCVELDAVANDDGIVFRLPEGESPPPLDLFFPEPDAVEEAIVSRLAETSLFAARFRENAGRALLLPKRNPSGRTPLWAIRRRSASLLSVASRFRDFPIVLETYRECLQDQFDLPGLRQLLGEVQRRLIRVEEVEADHPSPFASALMFQYVANFMYDGDAPLAERRAQALTIDPIRLAELLGESALRELIDPEALASLGAKLAFVHRPIADPDALCDRLLSLGDHSFEELKASSEPSEALEGWLELLVARRRVIRVKIAGEWRYASAEDAGKLRDALGVSPPPGLPGAFLEPVEAPLEELVSRYARTHTPFTAAEVAERLGLGEERVHGALVALSLRERVVAGEFIPGGQGEEWCSKEVLRQLRRLSLAKLRAEVEPVGVANLAHFLVGWHELHARRRGDYALSDVIDQLQGAPLPASTLEAEILPSRLVDYSPSQLDLLCAGGEVIWQGVRSAGPKDGRIALYTSQMAALVMRQVTPLEGERYDAIRGALAEAGASFFTELMAFVGGFQDDVLTALWDLVWNGEVSNDTLAPLRSLRRKAKPQSRRRRGRVARPRLPPGTEGRWWLISTRLNTSSSGTERAIALAQQLLERHGVLTREALSYESIKGGFSTIYPVLKELEGSGRVRRGYFVDGLGATQFAIPGAEDDLRRDPSAEEEMGAVIIAATDPANPFGAAAPWPQGVDAHFERAPGARVVIYQGELVAFFSRSQKSVTLLMSEDGARARQQLTALVAACAASLERLGGAAMVIEQIDGDVPTASAHLEAFLEGGFRLSSAGLILRRTPSDDTANARGRYTLQDRIATRRHRER